MSNRHERKSPGRQLKKDLPWRREDLAGQAAGSDTASPGHPVLIDCGLVGRRPLVESERRQLLATVNAVDAVAVVAEMQSNLDVALTTHGNVQGVELQFLAEARDAWVERVRKRVAQHDRLLSPRATTQLMREIIEWASPDLDAPNIDRSTLLDLLVSVTTEHIDLAQQQWATATPDLTGASLFIDALKFEILQSNTYDLWFRKWPARSDSSGLGATPAELFKLTTGIDLTEITRLGEIVASLNKSHQQIRFSRAALYGAGASLAAMDFLFERFSLDIATLRAEVRHERSAGAVPYQPHVLAQFPFLKVGERTVMMLRCQWATERLCGSLLAYEVWARLRANNGSRANQFKRAMCDIFTDVVGETLRRVARHNKQVRKVVSGSQMQAEWTMPDGEAPTACDWALLAGTHCILVDTAQHVAVADDSDDSDRPAIFAEYSADVEKTFTDHDFGRQITTINQLRKRGGFDGETIDESTSFIPLVIVPDAGLPADPYIQLNLTDRSTAKFEHVKPQVLPAGIMQLSDLQALEGLGDLTKIDLLGLVGGWRVAAAAHGEGLQAFLLRQRLPLPLSGHIRRTSKALKELARHESM